ncbi:restriction endonuclease subunit S [Bernardetia sp. MNP-M8]|uniref:restriction endonuclease subunit S n=1 Tax=Bernardetia sp. MNP-M8 TaxID=3127470 RepID=UPI0030D3362A
MRVKLKQVITDFIVPMRDKPKVFGGNIPWCRIEDVDGKYLSESLSNQNVSTETIKEMNLRVYPINTLLFTCSASIGTTAITKKPLCTNQTFIGLVGSNKIDIEYLYYYLNKVGSMLQRAASITTIPYLSRRFFEELVIDIPSTLSIQNNIANTLSLLDAKIELNNKINQELEAMTKTLYNYWFVQFDFPNEQGKPYKSSGGKMVYNKELKRVIPERWKTERITECCRIVDCLHSKKPDYNFEDERYYLLQLENLRDDGLIDLSNRYFVSKNDYEKWTSRIEVTTNDVVITNAGRVGATAQIPNKLVSGIGRNITAIRPLSISPTYFFMTFDGIDMKRQIAWNTDQGAFFTSLNVKGIKKLFVVRPERLIETKFENIVTPIRNKRELLQSQNQQLTDLRDWLLPMLMNEQITVKETELEEKE